MTTTSPTIFQKDIQQKFTSITRGLRKDLDNLLQIINTTHPSELDRENAVMNAVQELIAYDARVGQVVNKVKGAHAKVEELKSVEGRIASKKREYHQLIEELYTSLYRARDEVEEQRRIVEKLEILTGTTICFVV